MVPYNKMTKIIGRWTITCEFENCSHGHPIAASSDSAIRPLMLPDGKYDQLALDEYEDFVINLLGVFSRADFEVLEERQSPHSHSYYFDLVKKDQANKKDYKYILYVRVSDHSLSKKRSDIQRSWFESHAEEQKQPESKSKQVWRLKQITVNKDTYFSYDQALDELETKFQSMQ